jgi:GNAT superfamily N-acetyltransferase
MIELQKVFDKKTKKLFIDFPHDLYAGDANYVPELYMAMNEHLDEKKNPFYKTAKIELYLAYRDGKIVGRIATILNNNYNQFHNVNIGFFGFFDSINDQEVANALFDKAMAFGKSNGVTDVHGPTNFNTNDTAGLLVEGFDSPPMVQMTYNFPYYQTLIENYGFKKDMDLFAYWIPTDTVSEKSLKLSERLQERLQTKGITFRNINMKNFKVEVENVRELYKSAWEKNWGFGLKLVVDDRYAFVAEDKGKMVAFAIALPDINEIVKGFKKGRLFPFNIVKLLWGKKKVSKVRVALLGVIEEYRKIGIEAVLYANFISAAKKNNLKGGEASWILENNQMMRQGAENLNGQKYKTYRIYAKKI